MRLPGARSVRRGVLRQVGIPDEVVDHVALAASLRRPRRRSAALDGSGIEVPELDTYAAGAVGLLGAQPRPRPVQADRSLAAAVNGKTVLITGASQRHRARGRDQARARRRDPAAGRAHAPTSSSRCARRSRRSAAARTSTPPTSPTSTRSTQLVAQVLSDHPAVDMLVNNAGRSIRRSIALSYDRFHDFERTMQLNYLGAVKLILGLLPHMRARKQGHIVNISSIGVQTSPPRFSAYVASKAALDAFTRVVGSETIGDRVTFTTIHMPLVRTPMIAPTKIYDAFPTISPEEAADLVCDAIRTKPKQINTRLGTFGEVAYALAPKAVDQLLHLAYQRLPGLGGGEGDGGWRRARLPRAAGPRAPYAWGALVARLRFGALPVRRRAWSLPARPSCHRRAGLSRRGSRWGLADKSTRAAAWALVRRSTSSPQPRWLVQGAWGPVGAEADEGVGDTDRAANHEVRCGRPAGGASRARLRCARSPRRAARCRSRGAWWRAARRPGRCRRCWTSRSRRARRGPCRGRS